MGDFTCARDTELTPTEKLVFARDLERRGLSDNVWDLFDEWVGRSTPKVAFFYLKVSRGSELVGLGMFVKIKPFDLRASYSRLRGAGVLNAIGALVSRASSNSVIVAFRNLITSNHTRPFFFSDPELEDASTRAMLGHLKADKNADMVTVVDTASHQDLFEAAGFAAFPSSSEAWFDVTRYHDISEYLAAHRSLRKNLRRRRSRVGVEVRTDGGLCKEELEQVRACVRCSVRHSLVSNPCQRFFEENVFDTEVFTSSKYVHILVRVDGVIVGFHTFQVSGSSMGGVLGGFDRDHGRNNFAYERVIVASLEYAIENELRRIHYSLVDNHTKLRLVDLREPCGLYFFSSSPVNRAVFGWTFKHNDVYALWKLEEGGG